METSRIHPLIAGAAASVMLVSLVGAAAISGILPSSHSAAAPVAQAIPPAATSAPLVNAAAAAPVPATAPVAEHKTVVHHRYVTHRQPAQIAQAAPAPTPVYSQPAPQARTEQYHPVGIGVGAVVGGLLGNQVGGGNGRTLATIAGAVGGGYVGNEIAKRNQ
ncbi:glycine zipper 2TM domain-containing protein [Noviherbaspirillum humi]|uniref:glycine zipper 2TM domain-containing protein n=1 Tax=Noviherbaspirillum humi TaxID=1688639 RepID=UPI000B78D01C|nr:glycine zipper 2TM domain-containing protein [Noviherbaspirillum humi]